VAPAATPPSLSYAGPPERDESPRTPGPLLVNGILFGTPILLEIYMHAGAQWAFRREGRSGSLDFDATGTELYESLLVVGPIWALAIIYAGLVWGVSLFTIRARHSAALPLYTLVVGIGLWLAFCVFNALTLWDDISP
jgi:hypothetical protein